MHRNGLAISTTLLASSRCGCENCLIHCWLIRCTKVSSRQLVSVLSVRWLLLADSSNCRDRKWSTTTHSITRTRQRTARSQLRHFEIFPRSSTQVCILAFGAEIHVIGNLSPQSDSACSRKFNVSTKPFYCIRPDTLSAKRTVRWFHSGRTISEPGSTLHCSTRLRLITVFYCRQSKQSFCTTRISLLTKRSDSAWRLSIRRFIITYIPLTQPTQPFCSRMLWSRTLFINRSLYFIPSHRYPICITTISICIRSSVSFFYS